MASDIDVDANGLVHVPGGPGFGGEIDFDLIENNTVEVLR